MHFISNKVSACKKCPNPKAYTHADIKEKILNKFLQHPEIYVGYELLVSGSWTERTTKIKCKYGHVSQVSPRKIVDFSATNC